MLSIILLSAILSGLDNLQVCSAISLLPMIQRDRLRYAAAFATAEILAPLVGLSIGGFLFATSFRWAERFSPVVLLLCGACILLLAYRNRNAALLMGNPGMILGLPLLLSVDNLLAGIGLGAMHAPPVLSALTIGFAGAAMSCLGMYFGWRVRRLACFRLHAMDYVAGIYLCLLSLYQLVTG